MKRPCFNLFYHCSLPPDRTLRLACYQVILCLLDIYIGRVLRYFISILKIFKYFLIYFLLLQTPLQTSPPTSHHSCISQLPYHIHSLLSAASQPHGSGNICILPANQPVTRIAPSLSPVRRCHTYPPGNLTAENLLLHIYPFRGAVCLTLCFAL